MFPLLLFLSSEKWHCYGNYKVWPVWLPHWHCPKRWPQATQTTGGILEKVCFMLTLKSSENCMSTCMILSKEALCATPVLGAWRCCKHPWLEAGGKASEGFQSDVCSVLLPLNIYSVTTINTESPHWHPEHSTHPAPRRVSPGYVSSPAELTQHSEVAAFYCISD